MTITNEQVLQMAEKAFAQISEKMGKAMDENSAAVVKTIFIEAYFHAVKDITRLSQS